MSFTVIYMTSSRGCTCIVDNCHASAGSDDNARQRLGDVQGIEGSRSVVQDSRRIGLHCGDAVHSCLGVADRTQAHHLVRIDASFVHERGKAAKCLMDALCATAAADI